MVQKYWISVGLLFTIILAGMGWTADILTKPDLQIGYGQLECAAVSLDGTLWVTGSGDGKVRLWNTHTGELVQTLSGHTGYITSVKISDDNSKVVSGASDMTARLWDVSSGQTLHVFQESGSPVVVAISKDGTKVLSGSADKTATLWNAESGDQIQLFSGHQTVIRSLAISSDGTLVLTGAGALGTTLDNSVKLWNVATGAAVKTFISHY